jgi:hypothetical protein
MNAIEMFAAPFPPPLRGRVREGGVFCTAWRHTPLWTAITAVGLPHKGGDNFFVSLRIIRLSKINDFPFG